jgi:hypothetical protein
LVPSFGLISSSQSIDTLSDETSSNFTSLIMELAENQSEEQPMPSDDEADQEADN